MSNSELRRLTAVQAADLVKRREVRPMELLDAALERIREVDGEVNALPTLCEERARKNAREITARVDRAAKTGDWPSAFLGGVPLAVKDLTEVSGVRTTFGSEIFKDHIPAESAPVVERIEGAGGVVLAKSNTPEFGSSGNTNNTVFGPTRNPHDLTKSAGGSSGGSAAALASGSVWLATGTDLSGSLRQPASFCGVVGMRPSLGRTPRARKTIGYIGFGVEGPMARNVADCALLLDAMSGFDPFDPLSRPAAPGACQAAAARPEAPRRVGFSATLNLTSIDPEVEALCRGAMARLEAAGVGVEEEGVPDFRSIDAFYPAVRGLDFVARFSAFAKEHEERLRVEVNQSVAAGRRLTADDIGAAERLRMKLHQALAGFFEGRDLLVTPTTIVAAPDIGVDYLDGLGDRTFSNRLEWMALTYAVSAPPAFPAISLPCGVTAGGLPVGLQLIGKPYGDAALLAAAKWVEDALGVASPARL